MINGKLSILSTNVTGIKISEKRLKIFEYFRNLSAPAGFVFLQEPHSLVDVKKKKKNWNNFQGQFFFSPRKTNSCGVPIGYYGKSILNF